MDDTLHHAKYIRNRDAVFPGGSSLRGSLAGPMSIISKVGPVNFRWISFFRRSSFKSSSSRENAASEEDTNLRCVLRSLRLLLRCESHTYHKASYLVGMDSAAV